MYLLLLCCYIPLHNNNYIIATYFGLIDSPWSDKELFIESPPRLEDDPVIKDRIIDHIHRIKVTIDITNNLPTKEDLPYTKCLDNGTHTVHAIY